MEAIYPKVLVHRLDEFLHSLHPDTIVEMWVRLCEYNRYDTKCFNWQDLENMVRNCEHVVGLQIDWETECNMYDYPLSEDEIGERVDSYFKED